jgi:peptidyl-prolyl cis-trans isomerase A (cyclophilin A)
MGADRFYNLVRNRFFIDQAFYRYSPGFIVQFGISSSPAITAIWQKARIKDDPVIQSNKRGTLVFATAGPNTRSTDLFINLKDNPSLDAMGFSPIGSVTEGFDVVTGLYSGYGEMKEQGGRGPSQSALWAGGKVYLDKEFPKLDTIKSATVIFPQPGTADARKATNKSPTPTKKQ